MPVDHQLLALSQVPMLGLDQDWLQRHRIGEAVTGDHVSCTWRAPRWHSLGSETLKASGALKDPATFEALEALSTLRTLATLTTFVV